MSSAEPPLSSNHNMNPSSVDHALKNRKTKTIAADLVPDLHTLLPKKGLRTELDSHNAELTRHTITESDSKSIPPTSDNKRISVVMTKDDGVEELLVDTPGSIYSRSNALIPEWYRIGWTSFSNATNPGGSLNIKATVKENDPLSEILPLILFGEWYHNASALMLTGLAGYGLACLGGGLGSLLLFILFIGKSVFFALFLFASFLFVWGKMTKFITHVTLQLPIIIQVSRDFEEMHVMIFNESSPNLHSMTVRRQ
jgi:hypothetical protein